MNHTPVKHFREFQAMLRELDEWFENPDPAEAYHLLIDLRKAVKKATQHIPMYDAIEGARKRPELYGLDVGDLEEMSDQDIGAPGGEAPFGIGEHVELGKGCNRKWSWR